MPVSQEDTPHIPGPLAVIRSVGTTPGERDLASRVQKTCLSLWNYPNPWRAQHGAAGQKGDGKELCDLLVIFGNDVIIFSDKDIKYPDHADPAIAWRRWYKRSIKAGAESTFGAERWIRDYPDKIYLDSKCTQKIPVAFPSREEIRIHRIVVARGASEACRDYFNEGSGSLMIVPDIMGDDHLMGVEEKPEEVGIIPRPIQPFMVGQVDPDRGFVHVFDDTTLGIILGTLDTTYDFIRYLAAKERFIKSGNLISAAGEEDLLAHYLKRVGTDGWHDFVLPGDSNLMGIGVGIWDEFQKHPQRIAQIEADKPSYAWDRLIEGFSFQALNDSQEFTNRRGAAASEPVMRILAREPRTRRRMLADGIFTLVERARVRRDRTLEVRYVLPSVKGDPFYVFLLLNRFETDYQEYKERRRDVLMKYMSVVKVRHPEALDVVGVGLDYPENVMSEFSEDLFYLDARKWTDEDHRHAEEIQRTTGILKVTRREERVVNTYPDVRLDQDNADCWKGKDRNKPCHCGTGLKYKRCHGR